MTAYVILSNIFGKLTNIRVWLVAPMPLDKVMNEKNELRD